MVVCFDGCWIPSRLWLWEKRGGKVSNTKLMTSFGLVSQSVSQSVGHHHLSHVSSMAKNSQASSALTGI